MILLDANILLYAEDSLQPRHIFDSCRWVGHDGAKKIPYPWALVQDEVTNGNRIVRGVHSTDAVGFAHPCYGNLQLAGVIDENKSLLGE